MMSWKNIVVLALLTVISLPAQSDTVMLPPPPKQKFSDSPESYPDSRFGYPPQRVNTGISDSYAAQEAIKYDDVVRADEWDGTGPQTDRGLANSHPYARSVTESGSANRAPAGLVFGAPTSGADRFVAANDPRKAAPIENLPLGESSTPTRNVLEAPAAKMGIPSPEAEEMAIRKKGVQEVALIAGDLGYFPKTVFVTRDIPVRLFVTGASKNTLCIMMDSFQVRKQVRSQRIEEITFTPSLPGQYRFYCPVNGMEGTMVVRDTTS